MNVRKQITARHAENWYTEQDDPGLTLVGIWQALKIGFWARLAGLWNVTFFSSTARRCRQTARIAQLFFPETWFQPNRFRVSELLYVSARNGTTISDAHHANIEQMVADCPGDTFTSTHSQVVTKQKEKYKPTGTRYKVDPGSAYLHTANEITLLCGTERTLEAV